MSEIDKQRVAADVEVDGLRWRSYLISVPVPTGEATQKLRGLGHGHPGPYFLMLSEWVVNDVSVLVARAGGEIDSAVTDFGEVQQIQPRHFAKHTRLTPVGYATALALWHLKLPGSPDKALWVTEITTGAKPSLDDMRLRLAGIWRKLGPPPPRARVLMIGDMARNLDGVLIAGMNTLGTKSLQDLRKEYASVCRD